MDRAKIPGILRAAQETPWAILPAKLVEIRSFLVNHASGYESQVIQPREAPKPQRVGSVAVIPVYGTIGPRMNMMVEFSGGTSIDLLTAQIRQAIADREVSSILLDIDSPGGTVDGIPEIADEIRRSRDTKPIIASVNATAASAAYWIASQATDVAVTPSGDVGSIGVFSMHEDWSKADELSGVKTTFIHAGKYKVEANPFEPLSAEAHAHIQAQVNEYGDMFLDAVAAGRNMTVFRVRKEFGEYSEGRMALAKTAKRIGMVDRIESRDTTLARLLRRDGRSGSSRAAIETVRDLETWLIEEGFTRSEAKQLAWTGRKALALREADVDGDPDAAPREADAGTAADSVSLREAGERFRNALFK